MTNPKDSSIENTPVGVSSNESRNKEYDKVHEDQRRTKRGVDSTLGLPFSENVSGDTPCPQKSEPVEDVKENNITLKQVKLGSEESQGSDNDDKKDVNRLSEALSRLGFKDKDAPEGLPDCPETTSLGSVDASGECGSKGSERLSESSLESDGNVSDRESDIDSDGISDDSRDQLVERGPVRAHTSQPRHQGKPYDRKPASAYVVTSEQDDELMGFLCGNSPVSDTLSQHSSSQGSLDQIFGSLDQTLLEDIVASFEPTHNANKSPSSDQPLAAVAMTTNTWDLNNISPSSDIANITNPVQSSIPTVVVEKLNEKETETKRKPRKRTSRTKKDTPSPRKPSTMSECRSSVQQTTTQQIPTQQISSHVQPGLSQDFQTPSAMMEDAMRFIGDDLRRGTAQIPLEVPQSWPHISGTQISHVQMPLHPAPPVQQLPVQNYIAPTLFSAGSQTTSFLPSAPRHQGVPFQGQQQLIIPLNPTTGIAQQHQQPDLPLQTSTHGQTFSYGSGHSQTLVSQPPVMTNAFLRPIFPSSAQHKLTTAGTLGGTSDQLYGFVFQPLQPVRPVVATQISNSRFQNIVPKPS